MQENIKQHQPPNISGQYSADLAPRRLTGFIDDRNCPQISHIPDTIPLISLMKKLQNEKQNDFISFSVGTASNFDISQSAYQNILRNKIGKQLEEVIGRNVFVPKNAMTQRLDEIKSSLKEVFDLKFACYNDTMSAYVNIKSAIEHLLSKQNTQQALKAPNNSILIYYYCDAFPWMSWSKFFSGETSIRIKIVEPFNILSTALTVCSFLGPDNYEHIANLCKETFQQLSSLKSVTHPLLGHTIKVFVRGLGDGANRRTITGSSTAMSSYPIEEAPEHFNQLGDMTVCCPKPLRSVEETTQASMNYIQWLGDKKDTPDKRREFTKANYGLTGRQNICNTELDDFYPGTMHRCINSVQTICKRIHQVASLTQTDKGKKWESEVSKIARSIKEGFQVKLSHAGCICIL